MKNICVFDIDDTLLKTDSFIIKHLNGKTMKLNSEEFAKDFNSNDGAEYDFSDFEDPKKIANAIKNGKPIVKNLKILDRYANKGYEIAFLTARNNEEVIYKSLFYFLKVKNSDGELKPILNQLSRELSVAVSDKKYDDIFEGMSHSERKAEVLNDYCDIFDKVIFVDDDIKNLNAAKNLNRDNLTIIKA